MPNPTPYPRNPAAAAEARAILTDPQRCDGAPDLVKLAWAVLRSNMGAPPIIQHRLPRRPGAA